MLNLNQNLKVTQYVDAPANTVAHDVAWVDMRDFERILIAYCRTVGTDVTALKVLGNAAANGSGTDVELVADFDSVPDAVGDYAFVEVSAQEIREKGRAAGIDLRYVSLNATNGTAGDTAVVTYVRGAAKHAQADLTADAVA